MWLNRRHSFFLVFPSFLFVYACVAHSRVRQQSYKLDECGEDASITLDIRSEPEDGIDTPTKKSMCAEPRSSSKKSKNPVRTRSITNVETRLISQSARKRQSAAAKRL